MKVINDKREKQDEYLTQKEVCEILKIGRNTFENYWRNGKIPMYQIKGTKRKYVKRSDLQNFFNNKTLK